MKLEININDNFVNFCKKFLGKKNIYGFVILITIAITILATAAVDIPYYFQEGDLISAEQVNANFKTIKEKLDQLDANSGGAPVGAIMPFAGDADSVPAGWLLCDGSAIDRETYNDLYNVIKHKWGAGNASTTFNLPDLRGRFLRGLDSNAIVDVDAESRFALFTGGNTGEKVGSYQDDAFKSHKHSMDYDRIKFLNGTTTVNDIHGSGNQTTSTNTTGGSETRPKNAAVNYIIKYIK
jgi:microcystin-dependent protein